ncbi:MAG TPA: hypothetical protein VMF65_03155 [Acidimicrobiales bacterium]|nr:hypothetical protein [Acidimicrobiales bacterium]
MFDFTYPNGAPGSIAMESVLPGPLVDRSATAIVGHAERRLGALLEDYGIDPDEVIDPQLAQTEAGRVLLQSDLLLKQATVPALNPDRPSALEFWRQVFAMPGPAEWGCSSFRVATQWVRQDVGRRTVLAGW